MFESDSGAGGKKTRFCYALISDLNTVKIHRRCDWSGSNSRPVTVSGKDLQFVSSRRQCSAETMDRKNRPPMAHGGEIGRNDMEDSPSPPRAIQNKLLIAISESRKSRRKLSTLSGECGISKQPLELLFVQNSAARRNYAVLVMCAPPAGA